VIEPREHVPLGPRTTLAIGGHARYLFEATSVDEVVAALGWAEARGLKVEVLGGGSNVLVADRGLDALVLRVGMSERTGQGVDWRVAAGHDWDELVAWSVQQRLAGLECLSGIPGQVGAAPIQNVGAYGQEVGQIIERVELIERASGARIELDREACQFGYRDSLFKRGAVDRYVIVAVQLRFRRDGEPTMAYPELQRALAAESGEPSLARVRDTVVALRRNKSMVLDPADENRRSAGSFFVNPVLSQATAERVFERVAEQLGSDAQVPRYPAAAGAVKLPAAWLIERAGFAKGTRRGRVGISTRHSLALVNLGAATAAELLAFAAEIRDQVAERFGVTLHPEPRMLGFTPEELAPLTG
jgi:UDP-N-acetylmuramate dehydrogenase